MLSLSDIKEYLNIAANETDYDSALNRLIAAAEAWIKSYCNQNLITSSRDFLFTGRNQYYKTLPNFPVTTINKLEYRSTPLGAWSEIDSSNYAIISDNGLYWLYYDATFYASCAFNYKANYDYGYATTADIPEPIKQVGIELVAIMFKESDIFEGVKTGRLAVDAVTENVAGISTTTKFKSLINDWKLRLTPYRVLNV